MGETWKAIEGYETAYQVSDEGRVRSIMRFDTRGARRQGRLIQPIIRTRPNGYETALVNLSVGAHSKTIEIARLVANAFIPKVDGKDMVLHWDGDGVNNVIDNLRWGDHNDNKADSLRLGEYGKLTQADVDEIRAADQTHAQLARDFGVSATTVSRIRRGLLRLHRRDDESVDNGPGDPAEPGDGAVNSDAAEIIG